MCYTSPCMPIHVLKLYLNIYWYSLEFCNQAAGLAELFDSIVCNVDISAISDTEDDIIAPTKRITKTNKNSTTIRQNNKNSSDEDENDGSDDDDDVVQRRPEFSTVPTVPSGRERTVRSSKTLAQDKMSKLADENIENRRIVEHLE